MRRKHYIICFTAMLLGIGFYSEAQDESKKDSLLTIIRNSPADTNKLNALVELSKLVIEDAPQQAYQYGYQALALSRSLSDVNSRFLALYNYFILLRSNGFLDSSLVYTAEYLALAKASGDLHNIGTGYREYGNILRMHGQTDSAYHYFLLSINYYNQLHDTVSLISCYNAMGTIHRIRTAYDSASYYYLMAIKLSEAIKFERGMIAPLINMGKVSTYTRDYEKSREYSLRSLDITRKDSNLRLMAIAYANLGVNEYEQSNYQAAKDHYEVALKMNLRINNLLGINNMYNNLGTVYADMGNPEKALKNYEKAYNTFKSIDYRSGMTSALINMAGILARIGQYERAIQIYDSCLLLTGESGDLVKRKETYENIYLTYIDAGNYRKATEYLSKYLALHDSIYQMEKEELITDYTMKYEKEKDQARILSLENDNLSKDLRIRNRTNQRNIYLFTGSASLMLLLFIFIYYQQKTRKDRVIANQKIKQLEEEKKLLAARSIVDGQENERKRIAKELHDGLGVLLSAAKMQFTSIKDTRPENKPYIERANKLLEQASGDVRKISHNMMPGLLTRFGFYEAVEDLLEKVDETDGIKADCEITGQLDRLPENMEIMLYRIIQEMVNNTLKHAGATTINLKVDAGQEVLKIRYRDDGKGFDPQDKKKSSSLGLTSIESRVNFLGGRLQLDTAPGKGTAYSLDIPVRKREGEQSVS